MKVSPMYRCLRFDDIRGKVQTFGIRNNKLFQFSFRKSHLAPTLFGVVRVFHLADFQRRWLCKGENRWWGSTQIPTNLYNEYVGDDAVQVAESRWMLIAETLESFSNVSNFQHEFEDQMEHFDFEKNIQSCGITGAEFFICTCSGLQIMRWVLAYYHFQCSYSV